MLPLSTRTLFLPLSRCIILSAFLGSSIFLSLSGSPSQVTHFGWRTVIENVYQCLCSPLAVLACHQKSRSQVVALPLAWILKWEGLSCRVPYNPQPYWEWGIRPCNWQSHSWGWWLPYLGVCWSLSRVWLFCDPIYCSLPCSSVHGISQQEYWSGFPFPSPGDLPD